MYVSSIVEAQVCKAAHQNSSSTSQTLLVEGGLGFDWVSKASTAASGGMSKGNWISETCAIFYMRADDTRAYFITLYITSMTSTHQDLGRP